MACWDGSSWGDGRGGEDGEEDRRGEDEEKKFDRGEERGKQKRGKEKGKVVIDGEGGGEKKDVAKEEEAKEGKIVGDGDERGEEEDVTDEEWEPTRRSRERERGRRGEWKFEDGIW